MASIILLILSITLLIASKDLVYAVEFSPGAGFFPLWLGIFLLILSLLLLLNSTVFKFYMTEPNPLPGKQALIRVICILGSLLVSILMFERIGFLITMFSFVTFLLIFLEKYHWYSATIISALMVFAVYGIFKIWLNIPLPLGFFP